MMKKFTKITLCLLLCVFGVGLVACDTRTDKEKAFTYPSSADTTYGNGGLAVQKGDYIYFVNGYQSVADLGDDQQNASHTVGALMLMKLDGNGNIVTNEDGLLKDEYYITMSDRLNGFEATGLFISGDYLYFTSVCEENESGDKDWAKERVEFNRIKLNKTGKVEEVYQSGVTYENLEYEYYIENGKTFILVYEKNANIDDGNVKNKLVRVSADSKENNEIARDVSSVGFATSGAEIFYVKDDSENTKYFVNKYNIESNQSNQFAVETSAVTVKFVAGGNVYLSYSHGSDTDLKKSSINEASFTVCNYQINGYDTFDITDDGSVLVAVKGNKIYFFRGNTVAEARYIEDTDATSIKIIGYTNGCVVYYDNNNNIKYVSYYNAVFGGDYSVQTVATSVNGLATTYFDLEDTYLYFYATVGSNEYLHRVKVVNNLDEEVEMVGVYLNDDVPEEENTEE